MNAKSILRIVSGACRTARRDLRALPGFRSELADLETIDRIEAHLRAAMDQRLPAAARNDAASHAVQYAAAAIAKGVIRM